MHSQGGECRNTLVVSASPGGHKSHTGSLPEAKGHVVHGENRPVHPVNLDQECEQITGRIFVPLGLC